MGWKQACPLLQELRYATRVHVHVHVLQDTVLVVPLCYGAVLTSVLSKCWPLVCILQIPSVKHRYWPWPVSDSLLCGNWNAGRASCTPSNDPHKSCKKHTIMSVEQGTNA